MLILESIKSSSLVSDYKKGQSLVELLMTIGLASILIPAMLMSLILPREGRVQQEQRLEAVALVKEAVEATRSVRDQDWTTFAVNGTFHPQISGSSWSLSTGPETIGTFDRRIVISDVQRYATGEIVESGGTIDPSTKKVTSTVSWGFPFFSQISSIVYFTRHYYQVYTETTVADFDAGTKTNVAVTDTSGGEVVLSAGGQGNWCEPNLSIAAIDLPRQGVANAITAIERTVFAGTGENASGVSFANVTISNTNPPSGTIAGTLDGYKTNGVFGETNYAYLATDNNFKEIVIIDLTQKDANNKYLETGHFDTPGNGDGNSIFVSGNTGYMTSGDKFYTFNLSSKSGSRETVGNVIGLAGTGNKITVKGTHAYVATTSTTAQLQIIDINNIENKSIISSVNLNNGQGGIDVFIDSSETYAYVVTSYSTGISNFFIVDVQNKSQPVVKGSYSTNSMNPKGVVGVTGNKAIIVGSGGIEYQVIDVSNINSPNPCGQGLNVDTGINGIAAVLESDGDAYSYIITGDANAELKIIEGGPGGQYTSSGIFESQTFDATTSAAFNKFDVTVNKPLLTDITFQISVADAIDGSCNNASFTFVGPDATSNTYFTEGSAIPFGNDGIGFENPARCLRYRAYLSSTDASQTPIFFDITFNFSP